MIFCEMVSAPPIDGWQRENEEGRGFRSLGGRGGSEAINFTEVN